jgi:peptidoglycan/LPS O-acetylase OafA/YrhL
MRTHTLRQALGQTLRQTLRPTLGAALGRGRHNNLDLLRLLAAMAVVISHCWPLALGPGTPEPLEELTGRSLGQYAVMVFFFLSGLLVAESAARNRATPLRFLRARVARLFPGLGLALIVGLGLAVLAGATPGPAEVVRYLLRGLSLAGMEHQVTGSWAANPYPGALNGSLWTLFHEALCYAVAAALVWSGALDRPYRAAFVIGWVALGAHAAAEMIPGGGGLALKAAAFAPLVLTFLAGVAAWRLRDHLPLSPVLAVLAVLAAIALHGTLADGTATSVALGMVALVVAFRTPPLRLPGDLSYGVYLYGWPVSQALLALLGPMAPVVLAPLACLAVLPLAAASWVLVERPGLTLGRGRVQPRPA